MRNGVSIYKTKFFFSIYITDLNKKNKEKGNSFYINICTCIFFLFCFKRS